MARIELLRGEFVSLMADKLGGEYKASCLYDGIEEMQNDGVAPAFSLYDLEALTHIYTNIKEIQDDFSHIESVMNHTTLKSVADDYDTIEAIEESLHAFCIYRDDDILIFLE